MIRGFDVAPVAFVTYLNTQKPDSLLKPVIQFPELQYPHPGYNFFRSADLLELN